MSVLINF